MVLLRHMNSLARKAHAILATRRTGRCATPGIVGRDEGGVCDAQPA